MTTAASPEGVASRRSPGRRAGYGVHSVTGHSPSPTVTISTPTAVQASARAPEATNAAQISRPLMASPAWPKMSGGGRPPALARGHQPADERREAHRPA